MKLRNVDLLGKIALTMWAVTFATMLCYGEKYYMLIMAILTILIYGITLIFLYLNDDSGIPGKR